MKKETKTLSREKFEYELIQRFFNPKSYFFLCLNSKLNQIREDFQPADDGPYLLIKSLLDRLVAAQDKIAGLRELSTLNGFSELRGFLENRVSTLRTTRLTNDQLKSAIKQIAYQLVDILLRIIEHDDSRHALKDYLGLELPDIQNEPATDKEQQDTQDELVISSTAEEKLNAPDEITISSSTEQEPQEVLPQENLAEEEFVTTDHPLVGLFMQETSLRLEEITRHSDNLKNHPDDGEALFYLAGSFRELQESAMIHGFEAIESLSSKTAELLEALISTKSELSSDILKPISQVREIVDQFLQGKLLQDKIKESINELESLKKGIILRNQETLTPQETITPEIKVISDKKKPVAESKTSLKSSPKRKRKVTNQKRGEDENTLPFKIPGEDDEELLTLIQEVASANQKAIREPKVEASESDKIETIEESSLKSDRPSIPQTQKSPPEVSIFQEEAALYFKIVDEALKTLNLNPADAAALEDLELASYSLKGLAQKLGLERLGQLPQCIETLVANVISQETPLSSEFLMWITKAIEVLKHFQPGEQTQKEEFIKILGKLKTMVLAIKRNSKALRAGLHAARKPLDSIEEEAIIQRKNKLTQGNLTTLETPQVIEGGKW